MIGEIEPMPESMPGPSAAPPAEAEAVVQHPEPLSGDVGRPAGDAAATEVSGRDGPDPTRYGDWEKNGRCIDF